VCSITLFKSRTSRLSIPQAEIAPGRTAASARSTQALDALEVRLASRSRPHAPEASPRHDLLFECLQLLLCTRL